MKKLNFLRLPALALPIILSALVSACAERPSAEVSVTVRADSTLHRMAGGIGASWHAIEDSIPFDGRTTHGGSAWGANPDPGDDAAWDQVYRHAEWLGLNFLRVELEARMYEPERRQFTWDSREMRILYRILDWCESTGAEVFLQQMWINADWNAYPEFRGDPVKRVHSAAYSIPDFAAGLAALADHLLNVKGYTCIKWLCISNEPGWSWSWWQMPPNESAPFTPALAAVRTALDSAGINLPLSGPDWTDSPALEPEKIDFDPYIGAYDIHSYYSRYDWYGTPEHAPDLPLSLVVQRLSDWARWAHERGKPFFLTEVGSMIYGWRGTDPGPSTWPSALKDAQLVMRGLNVKVDAFNRWSFLNRGDLDGQWQMIETWDRENRRIRETFTPRPNSYFVYGLLSRFIAGRSEVLVTRVEGGRCEDGWQRVFAVALRDPAGGLALALMNDDEREWSVEVSLESLKERITLHKYQVTPATADDPSLRIDPLSGRTVSPRDGTLAETLPASSLTVYSTWRLSHDEPGLIRVD